MSGGLGFAAPGWFLAALLPVAYLLFARALERAPRVDFGSLRLWRAAREELGERAAKPGWRWRTVVRGLGLALVVVAMARPVWTGAAEPRVWTLVVGTGAAGALPGADGGTRVAAALAAGEAFGAERGAVRWAPVPRFVDRAASVAAGELVWRGGGAATDGAPAAELLLAAPPRADWLAWDAADHVWLPVTELGVEPARAGLERRGWPAAPGPVAVRPGGVWLDWDGARVSERPGPEPWVWARGRVWEAGRTLGRVLDATAATNGWRVVRGGRAALEAGPPVLIAWGPEAAAGGGGAAVGLDFRPDARLFGAGWSAVVRRAGAAAPLGLRALEGVGAEAVDHRAVDGDPLTESGEDGDAGAEWRGPIETVAGWAPGVVWTDLAAVAPPGAVQSDLAQLIVAWAAVLEAAVRPPGVEPGQGGRVLALASRQVATSAGIEPMGSAAPRSGEGRRTHLGAGCALLAAGLLLATLRS